MTNLLPHRRFVGDSPFRRLVYDMERGIRVVQTNAAER